MLGPSPAGICETLALNQVPSTGLSRQRPVAGAVGTSAVQLAQHVGADVTGVSSGANLELVRSLGAATVIDYTTADFTHGQQQYDVIFDAAGKRKRRSGRSSTGATGWSSWPGRTGMSTAGTRKAT